MPQVNNNGVRIHYETVGQGEPLVLIHGWSCEGRYWDECGYVERLRDHFQVILPDLRAHGESEVPANRDFTDEALASDVMAVLDDRGIDAAHMFGHSLGGYVVFELAAASPSRVLTASIGGAHPYAEDLSAIRGLTPEAILDTWKTLHAPLSERSTRRLAAFDPQVLVDVIAADRVDQSSRLEHLRPPCLLICGTTDWRFDGMQRFAAGNNRCEFVALEGLDHLQTFLEVDRFLPPVRRFIANHRSEREVRAAHERWFAGLLGNCAMLADVLANDVTFRFPDGDQMPRNEFLRLLDSGELSYSSAEHADTTCRIYGDAGVVTGRSTLGYRLQGKTDSERLAYTAVYVRKDGRWAMVAWQSTMDRL